MTTTHRPFHTFRSHEQTVAGLQILINQSYSVINRDSVNTVYVVRDGSTIICSHASLMPLTMKDTAFDSAQSSAIEVAEAVAVVVRTAIDTTRRTIAVASILHNEARSDMHPANPALLFGESA